jgi:hypothetical protein
VSCETHKIQVPATKVIVTHRGKMSYENMHRGQISHSLPPTSPPKVFLTGVPCDYI